MVMTIKNIILLVGLFFTMSSTSLADNKGEGEVPQNHPQCPRKKGPHDFNPEKFRNDMMVYVSRAVGFTAKESKLYFSLFFEMKDKQRSIERQKGRALQRAANPNVTERDCQRVLNEIEELNAKSQRIEKQFMDRMRKRFGAKKLVKAIHADREFGRNFFRRMTK